MALFSQIGKNLKANDAANESLGVVGIDIGTSTLKVVQLKMGQKTVALETYGELQLGPYAGKDIGAAVTLEPTRMTEALVDIVREANVTSRAAVLAIPSNSSFMVAVDIPAGDDAHINSVIPIEARKYIPVSLNDITLDWFLLPEVPSADKKTIRALLAAVHNDSFTRVRSIVQSAGLMSKSFEIEGFSTVRSSTFTEASSVAIECGASSTRLYIIEKGVVHDMHTVRQGAALLTDALKNVLGTTFGDAENIKRQMGLISDAYDPRIREAMAPLVERLMKEVLRVIARYETMYTTKIESISLSGGGALLKGFGEYVAEVTGKTVSYANPFSKVEYPSFLEDTLAEAGPSFAVALGVALRGMSEK